MSGSAFFIFKFLAIWLVALCLLPPLVGTAAPLQIRALRLPEGVPPPELDAVLDDPCWQLAPVISDFKQVEPHEGATPTEATEVRFAYDRKFLYIAIKCFDREPQRVTARELQRDSFEEESFPTDDHVQVIFDPFGRERDGFLFAVNPLGAMTDGRIEQSTYTMVEWDGLWDAKAVIDAQGWSAELRIPFSTLSFDPAKSDWGVNIQRVIRRREEMIRWAHPSQSRDGDWLQDIAVLHGLQDIDQGLGVEIKPYFSFRHLDQSSASDESELRAGFDASWSITPAVTATITVNTDFAEAEADARQVNLSRFPLFFPEKRDFFLRDAPYFSFPSGSDLLVPFYSRNIGRSESGEPVDLIAGGKFTGRAGPYTFGIFDVQQRGHSGIQDKNLLVARVTRELSDELTLGALLTDGDPYTNGSNTLLGTDLVWNTEHFLGEKHLKTELWWLGTQGTGVATDSAFGMTAYSFNQPWDLFASVLQIGDEFRPALGFLERSGIREYTGEVIYQYTVNQGHLRNIKTAFAPHVITTLDNDIESVDTILPAVRFTWDNGSQFAVWVNHKEENLVEPFEIRPGNNIPTGDYHFRTFETEYLGSTSVALSPSAGMEVGEFYDGEQVRWWLNLGARPSPHVFAGLEYEQYAITLPSGDFTTRLLSLRLNLAFSARISWNTLAQYDNESETFGINSRLRWTIRPGTDIYLILNQGYIVEDRYRLRHDLSETSIKTSVTWRF